MTTEAPAKPKSPQTATLSEGGKLPEISCLIIRTGTNGNVEILNLDDYDDANRLCCTLDAVERFGAANVRFCRILSMKVKTNLEFVE